MIFGRHCSLYCGIVIGCPLDAQGGKLVLVFGHSPFQSGNGIFNEFLLRRNIIGRHLPMPGADSDVKLVRVPKRYQPLLEMLDSRRRKGKRQVGVF